MVNRPEEQLILAIYYWRVLLMRKELFAIRSTFTFICQSQLRQLVLVDLLKFPT